MNVWVPLKDLSHEDVRRVGGKAASLGELLQAGLPVPDGFVVYGNRPDEQHLLSQWADILLAAFDRLASDFVAVRSSATNEDGKNTSWAGQLNTFLYVSRNDLLARIEDCLRSAQNTRAVAYARQNNTAAGQVAAIVQTMIPSASSGVAFSVHPVTKNHDHIIIEAGFGLGEAVVSGHITPDTYVVHKKSGAILERHIAQQSKQLLGGKTGPRWHALEATAGSAQKLHDTHIAALRQHVCVIEKHFGYPVDVEWAFANGRLYITQARPITTLA